MKCLVCTLRELGFIGRRTAYSFSELSIPPLFFLTSSLAPTRLPIFPRPEREFSIDLNQ